MKHESVQALFGRAAEQFRERTAIARVDERVSYGELEDRANNLANQLLAAGTAKGTIVAILSADPVEVITAILGILKAGCVFVPLDPNIPEARLQAMIAEVEPAWFLVQASLLRKLHAVAGAQGAGARVLWLDQLSKTDASRLPTACPVVASQPDDMCYVYFTSGSTGWPKGIAGRLKGIDHFVRWEIATCGVGPDTRVSQLITPSFDAFLRDVFTPLCAGGTVCVPPSRDTILDARALLAWLDQQAINLIHCVPSLFRALINQPLDPKGLAALKYVLLAGEPLLPADVRRWTEVYGHRIQLVNLYGPSETTMTKFFYFVRPSDSERRSIPIGQPMPGARALVLDAERRPCAPGVIGEIYIRTPYRTLGYYNRPDLTAEVFVQNPFNQQPDDLIYKTGDLGRVLEDGNFEFLGRRDHQVKIRGVRIELREIENLLLTHEQVRDVVVVDLDDADGTKYLCAYVVLHDPAAVGALKEHLSHSLPAYMLPSAMVVLSELPRTISGKVDRRALPPPAQTRTAAQAPFVAPRTPTEEAVALLWCELLGCERVGVNDSFFELGGHSLLATQLLSRVAASLGVEVPLRTLFAAPTVAGLAAAITQLQQTATPRPAIGRRPAGTDNLPLSFAQQRLWFIDQLEPDSFFFNISAALRLEGQLDSAALAQALTEVVRRHEVLRTRFETVAGEPRQVIAPPAPFNLPLVSLSELPAAERDGALRQLLSEEARRAFDLARGPLLRVSLLRLSREEHVLLFVIHHIVCDGWSVGILVREVSTLYEAYAAGQPSPLPELPIQYADYALWQREWLSGEVLAQQLSYWRARLAGAPTLSALPSDRPRPPRQTYRGATEMQHLPQALTEALKELSRREGVTLFMTLLAAFKALLYRHSGQADMILGSPLANRHHVELEGLIGFFANPLILRTDLSGDPTFRELLARVREATLGAHAHQDVPFQMLVEELQLGRTLSHHPLFQVAFTLDNPTGVRRARPELTISQMEIGDARAQLDLILHMTDTAQGLHASWQYNTDLFDTTTINGVIAEFAVLLERIVQQPDARLEALRQALLAEAERRRLARERAAVGASRDKLRMVKRQVVTGALAESADSEVRR